MVQNVYRFCSSYKANLQSALNQTSASLRGARVLYRHNGPCCFDCHCYDFLYRADRNHWDRCISCLVATGSWQEVATGGIVANIG